MLQQQAGKGVEYAELCALAHHCQSIHTHAHKLVVEAFNGSASVVGCCRRKTTTVVSIQDWDLSSAPHSIYN